MLTQACRDWRDQGSSGEADASFEGKKGPLISMTPLRSPVQFTVFSDFPDGPQRTMFHQSS